MKKLAVFACFFGLAALFGCATVQDVITPCYIPKASVKYANSEATSFLPFTTLFDSKRIQAKMDYVHAVNQVSDKMEYEFLKGLNTFHAEAAEQLQAAMFSPEGPIGLLLPTIFGGTLGALLIKRPGDKSPKELVK